MDCTQRNIFIYNGGGKIRESVHTHFIRQCAVSHQKYAA